MILIRYIQEGSLYFSNIELDILRICRHKFSQMEEGVANAKTR